MSDISDRILYEDNHLIAVNKLPKEIVQGDLTGDRTLADDVKDYIRKKYNKQGNVFLGIPHRLDRPTSGIVIYCKTSKSLERMNTMFRNGDVKKYYWAICDRIPPAGDAGRLVHYITRNSEKNKSFAYSTERSGAKRAELEYRLLASGERYYLLEIKLITGRHHQIRAQLAACGVHIRGDLKYGFPRSNEDGSICLHSRSVMFTHPVSGRPVQITASLPVLAIWKIFENCKHF